MNDSNRQLEISTLLEGRSNHRRYMQLRSYPILFRQHFPNRGQFVMDTLIEVVDFQIGARMTMFLKCVW